MSMTNKYDICSISLSQITKSYFELHSISKEILFVEDRPCRIWISRESVDQSSNLIIPVQI